MGSDVQSSRSSGAPVSAWIMLPLRLLLFALCQALFALGLGSWERSAAYWPLAATVANLVTVLVLVRLFAAEGQSLWGLFRIERGAIARNLLILVPVLVAMAPLAFLPNVWLAGWLFGDPDAALGLLLQPVPLWAALLSLLFPLTIAVAELPAYFGYIMPRLEAQLRSAWAGVLVPAAFLSLQHIALPLLFDLRFMAWRGLMFLPFAVFVGVVLRWRPSLLPYLVVVHMLLDFSVVAMLLTLAL